MNNENTLDSVSDFFYNITSKFLNIFRNHWTDCGFTAFLIERTPEISIDTLVVNFGTNSEPINLTFTFIPLPYGDMNIDTVFLQVYTLISSKPQVETMNELEKTLHFLNNQLPVGCFGISNNNEITLRSVQCISTSNYDLDIAPLNKIRELFEMIISIFTPHISDICCGKKTFKQLAFELS